VREVSLGRAGPTQRIAPVRRRVDAAKRNIDAVLQVKEMPRPGCLPEGASAALSKDSTSVYDSVCRQRGCGHGLWGK
jgi:hypothetical protein